ncbi:hypothetical protein ABZW49_04280 [Nonomuraea wenchangensis]
MAGDRREEHGLVFATKHGTAVVHDARHTAATLLIEQGVNIRVEKFRNDRQHSCC